MNGNRLSTDNQTYKAYLKNGKGGKEMSDEVKVVETEETGKVEERKIVPHETTKPKKVDNRLLKIAVIGCGNCGGQLANHACETLGIDGIAINGAERDLELITCPRVITFTTGDGKGTGKDRDAAKKFFYGDSGLMLDKKFSEVISNNDVIIVATSTGGGFGSGASTELIEALSEMYSEKVIIAAGVLPFRDEQYTAFDGTKKWLRELESLNTGYILYDNNAFADRMIPNKAAQKVNENFVNNIKVIQGDYVDRTFTGGIDERDMLTVLSAPGRIIIDSMENLEPSNIINGSIVSTIKNDINTNSAHAEMVSDKEIIASAFMYTLGDEFDEFKTGIKSELQEEFGTHVKDASNFSDEDKGTVALVVSGLSSPNMVIDRIINQANKLASDINERKASKSKLHDDADIVTKSVVAKKSFADEVEVKDVPGGENSKEAMLKKFLERKNSNN